MVCKKIFEPECGFFRDFESQAMQSGSEDPEVANVLQKCEEYVPGKVNFDW